MGDGGCGTLPMHEQDATTSWAEAQRVWAGAAVSVQSMEAIMGAEETTPGGAEELKNSLQEVTARLQALSRVVERMARSQAAALRLRHRCSNLTSPVVSLTRRRPSVGERSLSTRRAHSWDPEQLAMTSRQRACDKVMGLGVVNSYVESMSVWCKYQGTSASRPSLMRCYRLKYPWKMDSLFCEGFNITIDFSKVSNEGLIGVHKGEAYFNFQNGATMAQCTKTGEWDEGLLMKHMRKQLSGAKFEASDSLVVKKETNYTPGVTYLLPRDEDADNTFHSTADFMNMEVVYRTLGLQEAQVVLLDRFFDFSYIPLMSLGYGGGRQLMRRSSFGDRTYTFEHLVFHLESPAATVHERVAMEEGEPIRCGQSSLWRAYSQRVLSAFSLWDIDPPSIPHLTLSLRRRTEHKNVGRVMANEDEIIGIIKEGNMLTYEIADLAKMSFAEQLKTIRQTNVYIGIHGAGLMLIMFAAEEAILLEIHPHYRVDRHFRHAARLSGKIYMPMRTMKEVSCEKSSDNVYVEPDQFRSVLDDAVRIARSFDDGISECGLVCPNNVLVLDPRLEGEYDRTKTARGSTKRSELIKFPCHS